MPTPRSALMGEADFLVLGDRDLLEVSSLHEIPILTLADFLALQAAR